MEEKRKEIKAVQTGYGSKESADKKPIESPRLAEDRVVDETRETRSPIETSTSESVVVSPREEVINDKVPDGYILLPNGSLASRDEFNKINIVEEVDTKYIRDFEVPASVSYGSGFSSFRIMGDNGARFRLEIKNSGGHWYNWDTTTFTTTQSHLKRKIKGEYYDGKFVFIAGGKTEKFTYWLFALDDNCGKTKHVKRVDAFNEDGTIDLNNSVGSDSSLLQKESRQGPVVNITLSSIAPTLADGGEVFNGATHSSQTIGSSLDSIRSSKKGSFKITVTAASGKAIKIDRQPRPSDVCIHTATAVGAATPGVYTQVIPGEDIWSGTARSTGKIVNDSTTDDANVTMDDDRGSLWAIGDRVTGNTALDAKTGDQAVYITHVDVGNVKTFTMSEAITINDDESLTFTPPRYHRWPVTNYFGLQQGSIPKNNANITAGSFISQYSTYRSVFVKTDINCEETSRTIDRIDLSVGAIVPSATATFGDYGRSTAQAGVITFNQPQYKAFESTTHNFYSYGERMIKTHLRSSSVKITNLKAEIEADNVITTTISDASATGSASLNDFDVASVNGIMDDVSVVSGANITVSGGEPTVTTISSANLTLTPGGHTVQNGQTLTFSGAASVITITGNIEINNIGDTSTTLYFDVEKFLTCA